MFFLWLACVHQPASGFDPTIEDTTPNAAPKSPEATLLDFAGSDDPTLRGRAIAWLVQKHPDGYADRGLYDPESWVQAQTVHTLQLSPSNRDRLLGYVARTDDLADTYVQGALAIDLGPDALPALKPDGRSWRAAPLWLARSWLGDPSAEGPLAAILASGELPLEPGLLRDVGRSQRPQLVTALAAGQEQAEDELKPAYAAARVGLGDTGGEPALRALLSGGEVDPYAALEVLSPPLHGKVVERLLAEASRSNDRSLRLSAGVVQATSLDRGTDAFDRAMSSDDRDVRKLAVEMLATAGPGTRVARNATKILRKSLVDPDPWVRVAGLVALQEFGVSGYEDLVRPLLDDDEPRVRLEAAGAMYLTAGG